jgi:hypothetical protein
MPHERAVRREAGDDGVQTEKTVSEPGGSVDLELGFERNSLICEVVELGFENESKGMRKMENWALLVFAVRVEEDWRCTFETSSIVRVENTCMEDEGGPDELDALRSELEERAGEAEPRLWVRAPGISGDCRDGLPGSSLLLERYSRSCRPKQGVGAG